MWRVTEFDDSPFFPVTLILNQGSFGKGFPKASQGELKKGFCFYSLTGGKPEYITTRIVEKPVLTAVTRQQFESWQKQNLVAVEASCKYQEYKGSFLGWGVKKKL